MNDFSGHGQIFLKLFEPNSDEILKNLYQKYNGAYIQIQESIKFLEYCKHRLQSDAIGSVEDMEDYSKMRFYDFKIIDAELAFRSELLSHMKKYHLNEVPIKRFRIRIKTFFNLKQDHRWIIRFCDRIFLKTFSELKQHYLRLWIDYLRACNLMVQDIGDEINALEAYVIAEFKNGQDSKIKRKLDKIFANNPDMTWGYLKI